MTSDSDKISFAIGIPTINQYRDKLQEFLISYDHFFAHNQVYIIDNGNQGIDVSEYKRMEVIVNKTPMGVAASWNHLAKLIFKTHTHGLFLNDDILLAKNEYDIMRAIIDYRSTGMNFSDSVISSQRDFCAFILPRTVYIQVGPFDENFKGAYFEDKDYERRLKMAKIDVVRTSRLDPSIYYESSSVKKDARLNNNFQKNHSYYKQKWGGNVGGEVYQRPFNQ